MDLAFDSSLHLTTSEKVLLVADRVTIETGSGLVLARAGFDLIHAATDAEVHAALAPGQVAVAVVDLDLPALDGIRLLRELVELHPGVIVILLTQAVDDCGLLETLRTGAASFLRKPVDPIVLQAQVAFALRSSETRRNSGRQCSLLQGSLRRAHSMLDELPRQLAERLCGAWDLRHVETGAHIRRMAAYTEELALQLGFEPVEATTLGQVAMLHDVGKLAIPDDILAKPGKLTAEEFEIIKSHTEIGARMLHGLTHPFLERAALVALRHHERWDGSGYPGNLRGEACPSDARIVAVADVYDALGHARSYKPDWSHDEIERYFRAQSGVLFEPRIVDALFECMPQLREIDASCPEGASDFASHRRIKAVTAAETEAEVSGVAGGR